MNRLSKWLLFPVVLLLFIAVFSLAVADVIHEGTWEGFEWTLDDLGILTIRGEGSIPDGTTSVFSDYRQSILEVIVEDGITEIGANLFNGCYPS